MKRKYSNARSPHVPAIIKTFFKYFNCFYLLTAIIINVITKEAQQYKFRNNLKRQIDFNKVLQSVRQCDDDISACLLGRCFYPFYASWKFNGLDGTLLRIVPKITENGRKAPKMAEKLRKSPKSSENGRKSPKSSENWECFGVSVNVTRFIGSGALDYFNEDG